MIFERRLPAGHAPHGPSLAPSRPRRDVDLDGSLAHRRSPTRHLTVYQYVRLLDVIDELGGIATLDGISRALPSVEQPVSAVFDLCEADVLCGDWESAFDGDMRVWRADR